MAISTEGEEGLREGGIRIGTGGRKGERERGIRVGTGGRRKGGGE